MKPIYILRIVLSIVVPIIIFVPSLMLGSLVGVLSSSFMIFSDSAMGTAKEYIPTTTAMLCAFVGFGAVYSVIFPKQVSQKLKVIVSVIMIILYLVIGIYVLVDWHSRDMIFSWFTATIIMGCGIAPFIEICTKKSKAE